MLFANADAVIWDLGWDIPQTLPVWDDWPLPVVALLADIEVVDRVWASGVHGLLTREIKAASLVAAAHAVGHGLTVIEPEFALALVPRIDDSPLLHTAVEGLTERESEVLQLVAEGLTNKAIARQLHISDHTVKFHVNAVMTKLNAQSRTEAVVRATRMGLLRL